MVGSLARTIADFVRQAFSILPSFGFPAPSADQFVGVARATPAAMFGHSFNTAIAVIALLPVAGATELTLWAAVSLGLAAWVMMRRLRAMRSVPHARSATAVSQLLERRAILFGLAIALPWAYLGVRFLGRVPPVQETIVISLVIGMASSGAVLLAPVERAAATYMSAILWPVALSCLFVLDSFGYAVLGGLAISYWGFLLALIGATNQLFKNKSEAVERLSEALSEASFARAETEHLAMHDSLTELANRRAFLHRLNSTIMKSAKAGTCSWAVLMVDLDRFKVVNDTLGHKFGDELLCEVAKRMRRSVRPSDMVARLGGDEFCILADDVSDLREAEEIALRLLNELERPFDIFGRTLPLGISVGIAAPLSPETSSDDLMRRADLAMYEAKAAGGHCYRLFEMEMQDRMAERSAIEIGLRSAIQNNELELYYQPIYELSGLRLVRFEALIRWRHPVRGLLAPGLFLPVAEEIGLINEIGDWVVREACREAVAWPAHVSVAVNLSPIQVNHGNIVSLIEHALDQSGLAPHRLEIEITETALLHDTVQTKQKLSKLKSLGVVLTMDDFGTGYSSLSYLARFPLDGIKVEKAFIDRFDECAEDAEIMRAMVKLARNLNRTCTVEGIETLDQLTAAQSMGATYGQGYHFSPPLPASRCRALVGVARKDPRYQAG